MAVSPTQRRLAAALKQLRARSGLSAAELGRVLGWTQTRVSRAENGVRRVSLAEAVAWADATSAPDDLRAEVTDLAEAPRVTSGRGGACTLAAWPGGSRR